MKKILYGVSSAFVFGNWDHVVYGPFRNHEEAEAWLNREEERFADREIMGKTKAIRLAGKKAVENAIRV